MRVYFACRYVLWKIPGRPYSAPVELRWQRRRRRAHAGNRHRTGKLSMGIRTLGLLLSLTATSCYADLVHAPVAISSPQGEHNIQKLIRIINQSGLSSSYISGETDFESFTANTTNAPGFTYGGYGFTGTRSNGPQQFTFDLGASVAITQIAIWNTDSDGAISSFEVHADDDLDFSNGTTGVILGPSPLDSNDFRDSIPGEAQVFELIPTTTRYVHINGLSTLLSPGVYGLAEVAFAVVPAPGSGVLLCTALLAMSSRRRGL